MSSFSDDVRTPKPLEINWLWKFFPEFAFREGEPDPPPLGPFMVRGDYIIERKERDVPVQRFLILQPTEGCGLSMHNEYAVEYPEKLISADFVTFERKGSASRIRTQLTPAKPGLVKICHLALWNDIRSVRHYVVYEQQVEGTWIPVETDGDLLRP